jgi:hypothetical protein
LTQPEIERDIPIPTARGIRYVKNYGLDRLDIGDSIFVRDKRSSAYAEIARQVKKYPTLMDRKYITKETERDGVKGTRIWRIQ